MLASSKAKMIPSPLFDVPREEHHEHSTETSAAEQQIDSSFSLPLPECNGESDNGKPAESVRKALLVLANAPIPIHLRTNNNVQKNGKGAARNSASDESSISTASTSPIRDEESDVDTDQENENSIIRSPPDSLFIVQGKEFPCHAKLLSKEARPLLDILSRDGVLERKTKKQRTTSSTISTPETEQPQAWSCPSGITVARLPEDVDADSFERFMEFLYTKEIRMKLPDGYHEDEEVDDPWILDEEEIFDDDEDVEDVGHLLVPPSPDEEETSPAMPLKFLQEFFFFAGRFGCDSLKHAIENKIYDEFLFSFTAKELYTWANDHECAFLKDKAREKMAKTGLPS